MIASIVKGQNGKLATIEVKIRLSFEIITQYTSHHKSLKGHPSQKNFARLSLKILTDLKINFTKFKLSPIFRS